MAVGLVGVGTMGKVVASALVRAGDGVVAYDIDPSALRRVQELGTATADDLQDLAERAEIILLLLPGPAQIEAVVAGDRGLLEGARSNQVIVDMSTVDPATTRRMGARAKEAGVAYLDAPILGRPSAFDRWVLPVGGEPADLELCRPILDQLSSKVIHVGPLGSGHALKLLNALMFSAINAMTAEMMAISMKAGIPPKAVFDVVSESEAATVSGLFKEVGAKIVSRDFTATFSIDLLCKDSALAIGMARNCDAVPILASAIHVMNELASIRGLGGEDTSALVKVYETLWAQSQDSVGT